ncbi:MAG: TlpA family protein disulfide reductase [Gammaproteobacteria bacterium]|nr:TlpA family protein disulfide reductase [Gammaproteobacteria bacterium]
MKNKLFVLLILLSQSAFGQVPDMPLKKLDGTVHQLSDYQGNWIIVNYWATWCPPCIAEMPDLQDFHDKHADNGAVVIGINVETAPRELIEEFLDTYFITYPNYSAPLAQSSALGSIPGLPTTFLVSPEGKVAARQVGGVTSEMIESFIKNWKAK